MMPMNDSLASWLASRPADQAAFLASLDEPERAALLYRWEFWARPNQLPPATVWRGWLLVTGRGWGKTKTAAEFIRSRAEANPHARIALLNDTAADVRDVNIEGPSGVMAVSPPWFQPIYEPSKRRVIWPNGAIAIAYAAEAPELLRGPEHTDAWADEPAKWKNLRKRDQQGGTAWDNLMFGLRIGADPRWVATTTPRGSAFVRGLMERPNVVVTRGTSDENRANLSDDWYAEVILPYRGTRLGRQEIGGEILEDTPGALWSIELIEAARVTEAPALSRIVVAIDPSGGEGAEHDEVGIVAAGVDARGHGYVLCDVSGHYSADGWGKKAVELYRSLHADRLIGETNFGGDMVAHTIRVACKDVGIDVAYKTVTASRGKAVRAEPIAALYEQGRVHHVGALPKLESELTGWVPNSGMRSPNRLDGCVWALTELMLGQGALRVWGGDEVVVKTEDEQQQEQDEQYAAAVLAVEEAVASGGDIWFQRGR